MNGVWMAVGGFIGAMMGSLVVELYRQRNRLRLAAIDKRLEAYQEGFRWVSEMAPKIWLIQNLKRPNEVPQRSEERQKLEKMRDDASIWLKNHYLFLDAEVGQQLAELFTNGEDVEQFRAARDAITRAAGLPSLKEDWWPFGRGGSQKARNCD